MKFYRAIVVKPEGMQVIKMKWAIYQRHKCWNVFYIVIFIQLSENTNEKKTSRKNVE